MTRQLMRNRELFVRDPMTFVIPNDGVSKVGRPSSDRQWEVLRYELTSFVCQGEYARGLQRILDSYLRSTDRSTQPAVWISGFYGSGKSHLVRVLEHLWNDTLLPDNASARSLVAGLPDDLRSTLTELDTLGRRLGAPPKAFAGSLDAAGSEHLNHAVAAIVLAGAGLPVQIPAAQLVLWLRDEGLADAVSRRLVEVGTTLTDAARRYNLSVELAEAIIAERPQIAAEPRELLQRLKTQFASTALSTAGTVELVRSALTTIGRGVIPPTLLVVDEVQQYIGDSSERALAVQGLAQALTSQFDGRVLLVATGQQELTAHPELQKIQDRFSVKVHLRNADVDEVVRRVLLHKKPDQMTGLDAVLSSSSGEIGRQLQGARLQHTNADDALLARDYPLLPSRRRFWEEVLRQTDQGGRAGQLRSQLRVVHEANRLVAEEPVGTVVGADFLYVDKNDDMNASGKLSRDVQTTIARQVGAPDGELRARILSLLHLISLLPTEGPADTGIRPTAVHLADLLVRDLDADGATLRQRVPVLLDAMVADSLVQADGDQYAIQTEVGRTWSDDFRGKRAALGAGDLANVRDTALRVALERQLPTRIVQGRSKVSRQIELHVGDDAPAPSDRIPVWVRSEWEGVGRTQFADLTRSAGDDSAIVYAHLPRLRSDELRDAALDARAAEQVLQTQPTPTTDEGRLARRAMETRLNRAHRRLDAVVSEVVARARVEISGGAMPDGASLNDRITDGATRVARRLYDQFDLVDDPRWNQVLDRIAQGNEQPLDRLGWRAPADQHPAATRVLGQVGAGWTSAKAVQDVFTARPYGWGLDAIRGLLAALIGNGDIAAQQQGTPLDAGGLLKLGTRLGTVQLRCETVSIGRLDQIKARGLAQRLLGGNAAADAPLDQLVHRAVELLRDRAQAVGGDPPLPRFDLPAVVTDLARQSGNAAVAAFLAASEAIDDASSQLDTLQQRRNERLPRLLLARALAAQLTAVDAAGEARGQLAELEASRELLAADDHVSSNLDRLVTAGRDAVQSAGDAYALARKAVMLELMAHPVWSALTGEDGSRLLAVHQLGEESSLDLRTPADVLAALTQRPLAWWADRQAALSGRASEALAAAAQIAVPTAVSVGLPGRTITSAAELEVYLDELRARLTEALSSHDTIVVRSS